MQSFLTAAREFGKNTSLVVFFNDARDIGIANYETEFWNIINALNLLDVKAWPASIPTDPEESTWEFSFGGEAIFVVCNTPSHKLRRSRYGSVFTLTFQPRWVFDGIIGPGAPLGNKIKEEIRRRLNSYDDIAPSPFLGSYGEPGNLEWKQYFLDDTNATKGERCPFGASARSHSAFVTRTPITSLEEAVMDLLPKTGSIEVQRDTPYRRHGIHKHPTDETLHIVNGEITFQIDDELIKCGPGERLLLPRNTLHASTAGKDGCCYVIATRIIIYSVSVNPTKEINA